MARSHDAADHSEECGDYSEGNESQGGILSRGAM